MSTPSKLGEALTLKIKANSLNAISKSRAVGLFLWLQGRGLGSKVQASGFRVHGHIKTETVDLVAGSHSCGRGDPSFVMFRR